MSSLGRPPAAWAPHTGTRCWPRCAGPCLCGTPFGETSSRQNGPGWAQSCPGPGPSSAPMPLPSPAGAMNAGVPHRSPHEPSWSFCPDCSGGVGLAGCLGTQGFLPQRASWGWATTQERQLGTGPSCSHFEIPLTGLSLGLGLWGLVSQGSPRPTRAGKPVLSWVMYGKRVSLGGQTLC